MFEIVIRKMLCVATEDHTCSTINSVRVTRTGLAQLLSSRQQQVLQLD